jgi:hypothetical protein
VLIILNMVEGAKKRILTLFDVDQTLTPARSII